MATKKSKSDASRDIMECSICKDAFKTPKCLPCIHTFCLECLEKHGEDERPGDEMPCPLCRQAFKIPEGGFKKLPNNIFIDQILASLDMCEDDSPSKEVKCEVCDKTESSKYCVECAQSICEGCAVLHAKVTATRTHKIGRLQEMKESQMHLRARPSYCDTLKDKQLELYCHDCNQAICLMCSVVAHRHHLCADVQTSSREFADKIKIVLPRLEQSIETIADEQKALAANKTMLLEQISECERAVNKRGAELQHRGDTDSQCRKLLEHLYEIKIKLTKNIKTRNDEK